MYVMLVLVCFLTEVNSGTSISDSYIDYLVARSSSSCDKACIIGLDGGAMWTTDSHVNSLVLKDKEGENIAKCFKSKNFTLFRVSGITIAGQKYTFMREEDSKFVIGIRKDLLYSGVALRATKTAIVIAHCKEGGQQEDVNAAAISLARRLESSNY